MPEWGYQGPVEWSLGFGEVHTWTSSSVDSDSCRNEIISLLAPEEQSRACSLFRERDAKTFAYARAMLRIILGGYLGMRSAGIRFGYSRFGKPFVEAGAGNPPLQFNVSHSEDRILMAFTRGPKVGVDVERIRTLDDLDSIARRFFSGSEHAALVKIGAEDREAAFFRLWTRKEAYVKAVGMGLSIPLDQFEVEARDSEAPRLIDAVWSGNDGLDWSMYDCPPHPDFSGALVVEGNPVSLEWFVFTPDRWRERIV